MARSPYDHPFVRRCVGSFLGLALGDAFGRPLEFLKGPSVRTKPLELSRFQWTDDAQMALYLAEAILRLDDYERESFGLSWRDGVIEWLADPMTPSTAPGNTCLAAAARARDGAPWTTSGVRRSDGCGAVMRVAPLAMRWRGQELMDAAEVSALVTHAHPNAPAAAQVLCRLLREVLEGVDFDAALVRSVADWSRRFGHPPVVALALEQAASWAESQLRRGEVGVLPEHSIETGDGGWRSVSCVALAVAAVLATSCFEEAIELATRIDGDSDSVGAVAGMLAGAIWHDQLPATWVGALPAERRFRELAVKLAVPSADGIRTSLTHPLKVDVVRHAGHSFGITFAPGKRASSLYGAAWRRDLGIDLAALPPATVLVSLVEEPELGRLGIRDLVEEGARKGVQVVRIPVPDRGVPSMAQAEAAVACLLGAEGRGIVHCRGGVGRAGTIAACALVRLGVAPDDAIARIRRVRSRHAVETPGQERFVRSYARRIGRVA